MAENDGSSEIDALLQLVDQLPGMLFTTNVRFCALSELLVERGVLSGDEIRSRMAALDQAATLRAGQ